MKGHQFRKIVAELKKLPGLTINGPVEETDEDKGEKRIFWVVRNELNVGALPLVLMQRHKKGYNIEYTLTSRNATAWLNTSEDVNRLVLLWRLQGVEGDELIDTLNLPSWKQLELFALSDEEA